MALAKKCDRCGKFYEHYPVGNRPGEYNAVAKVRRGSNGGTEYTSKPLDLCSDCMELLEIFINGSNIVQVKKNERRNKVITDVDISKFKIEEQFESALGYTVLYFIAPKELVANRYPEAEHATVCIEWSDSDKEMDNYSVTISPTKDGEDYDWMPFELDAGDVEQLIAKVLKN